MSRTNEWDNVNTYPDLGTPNSLCSRMLSDKRRSYSAVEAAVTRKVYRDFGDCSWYGDKKYHYLYLRAQMLNDDKWHKRRGLLLEHLEGSKVVWYWEHGLKSPHHYMIEAHKHYVINREADMRNIKRAKYAAIPTVHF